MTSFLPHQRLRDRVVSIDVVESSGRAITVLPTVGAVLGIQVRGRVRGPEGLLSSAGITGVQSAARRYEYLGETGSLLVRFTAQGAACLGLPASLLSGRSVALADILPAASVRDVHERLCAAVDVRQRVAVIEAFLAAFPLERDPLVARAITLLEARPHEGEMGAVAAVARALALSERQLERRFLARVGVTPKRFAMLRRFERAVAHIGAAPSLTRAALDAGYYDQSHFIRDFRRITGSAPGAFFAGEAGRVGSVQSGRE